MQQGRGDEEGENGAENDDGQCRAGFLRGGEGDWLVRGRQPRIWAANVGPNSGGRAAGEAAHEEGRGKQWPNKFVPTQAADSATRSACRAEFIRPGAPARCRPGFTRAVTHANCKAEFIRPTELTPNASTEESAFNRSPSLSARTAPGDA